VSRLFLFAVVLLLLVHLVRDIDPDTELVPKLVDTRSLSADDPANELPVDVELRRLDEMSMA
jgi:hypothetical protein